MPLDGSAKHVRGAGQVVNSPVLSSCASRPLVLAVVVKTFNIRRLRWTVYFPTAFARLVGCNEADRFFQATAHLSLPVLLSSLNLPQLPFDFPVMDSDPVGLCLACFSELRDRTRKISGFRKMGGAVSVYG